MKALSEREGVVKTAGHMCKYGMMVNGLPARKPPVIITNRFEVARRLQRKCCDKLLGEDAHVEHANMFGGQARKAQIYPRLLCYTILEGIAAQKMMDKRRLKWHEMMSLDEVKMLASIAGEDLTWGTWTTA